jgi:protein O-mannosyl-transferase
MVEDGPMTPKKTKRVVKREVAQKEVALDSQEYWIRVLIIAVILLFTALIYSNSLRNGFIYFDDPELVLDNYFIRQLTWENVVHYFTTPVQMTYLPVGLLSYAIDYQIAQLDPYIYHLNSLIIHLCNIVLVYWIFQLLTRKFSVSIFVTVIFAIHPVSVDGIVWVATRNNLLATFFYLGSLLFYILYLKRGFKLGYLALSCLSFLLSGLSKSSSVVLPLSLLLLDYYYDRKWNQRLVIEKIPFLLISLLLGIITLNVRTDVVPPVDYNLLDRFFIFSYSLTDYFVRLLFPLQLSMSYAYPAKDGGFLPFYFYLSPFILCLIVWGLYKLGVTKKVLIIGLSFFVINIFLSQSVMLIDNFMANRYAYLSYIGLFFILADINEQILTASEGWKSKIKFVWIAALVIFVAGFSFLTYNRNFVWKDTVSLFDDVISKQPNIPWVYSNRGVAKYRNGDFEGALQDFNYSLELDPYYPLSLYYRGVLNHASKKYDEALADLDQTVSLVPDFANAYNDRGKLKRDLHDDQGAMDDFSAAIEVDPYFVEAYLNRGILKHDLGDYQGAVADYSTVLSFDPENTITYYDRGLAEMALGDYQSALSDFSIVIELDPSYAEAFYMRSIAKLNLNDPSGSCEDLKTALSMGYQPPSQEPAQNCP